MVNAKTKAIDRKKGERAIDYANRVSKKPETIGYGTSINHKKRWAKYYKTAGSNTDHEYR